ncbi:MAG: ABC transporter permease [Conexibacter sp.]
MRGRLGSWTRALRPTRLRVGVALLAAIVLFTLLMPLVSSYGTDDIVGNPYAQPSSAHPLGLDDVGADVLTLLAYGGRISLLTGMTAALVAIVVGTAVGTVAGYFGGRTDVGLMLVVNYLLVIPGIPLMIVVAAVFGASTLTLILAIGLVSWPATALVLRSQTKSLRERMYVDRARSLGSGNVWILTRHVLPELTSLIAASTALMLAQAVFLESALSFLGLGDPTRVSWGSMISSAFERGAASVNAWWALAAPGIAITLVVLACSLIGQAIEERANPRLRASGRIARRLRLRPTPSRPAGDEVPT